MLLASSSQRWNFPLCAPLWIFYHRNREREFDTVRNRVRARQRDTKRGRRWEGEISASFFLSSPKPAAHFGQWFSKIDFGKRVRERERVRERDRTCGDFRNSSPKLYQMKFMLHFAKLLTFTMLLSRETGLLLSQTSQFISYLVGPTDPAFDLVVLRVKVSTLTAYVMMRFRCIVGKNANFFQVKPHHLHLITVVTMWRWFIAQKWHLKPEIPLNLWHLQSTFVIGSCFIPTVFFPVFVNSVT